ncbi:MAG: SUF system NifU family Fe-S cluster assembly protein [Bacilli bacterium]|nr:SUF system NifU family Fe-S cluster assembly protein [Bacilli bacterium]
MPTSIELSPLMMREIIMDHYSSPRHKSVPTDKEEYLLTHSSSVNCIDDIDVFLKEENGEIVDACWEGTACAISTASTDIVCDLLLGKKKEEALYIIEQYNHMIHEEEYDGDVLEEALAFQNTHKQAARIHCATIGWDAFKQLIEEEKSHE